MLSAGYKANVIPSTAEAVVDCRVLPGREEAFLREVDELLGPDVTREWVTHLPPVETPYEGPAHRGHARRAARRGPRRPRRPLHALRRHRRQVLPRAGDGCYGFAPLRLPPDLDFAALFHGIDERVPVDALTFGTRVLETFLRSC
jgi:acetylornithine deacetylase/succinyl-diaminopimelate desuccinylase-like protein